MSTTVAVTQQVLKGNVYVAEKETGWQHPEWELTTASGGCVV